MTPPHPSALRAGPARDGWGARLGPAVGLDGVLAGLDRAAVPCDVPGEAATSGFTWDASDAADDGWRPQGVACLPGGRVLLVAWYAPGRTPFTTPARVSVVDRADPARPRYAHVDLLVPRPSPLPPGRAHLHAGGLAVVGRLLLVADTWLGVRVFRLDDVVRLPGGRFGLPQLTTLRLPLRRSAGRLRVSFLSATPDRLVLGEYGRAGSHPRLAEYPLDLSGTVAPLRVHEEQPLRMQGVAVDGDAWFVSASAGRDRPGDLHVGRPGAFVRHRGVLPPGPEDLDWSVPGQELWCATEWPGKRFVFSVDAGRWR